MFDWPRSTDKVRQLLIVKLSARNTFAPPGGIFETMYFLKQIVWRVFWQVDSNVEWGVCLLSSCKVSYPHNKIGVTVQAID